MKKILLVATLLAFAATSAFAGNTPEKGKKAKSKKECVKEGEKKSCCASKQACKKPAAAPTSEVK